MLKPLAAAVLVSLSLAGCGGKTIEVARNDGKSADPQQPTPLEPADPGPPLDPSGPPTPTPTPTPVTPCGASFRYDVLRTLQDRGCSNSSCHGGATPRNEPRIDPTDLYGTWAALHAFTLSNGQPYLAPVASAPLASAMHCHLRGECGTSMTAFVTGGALSPKELGEIDAWLACGAPFD